MDPGLVQPQALDRAGPVGSFRANRHGLYDMLGNVWEWTCSKWVNPYNGSDEQCISKNRATSASRVIRGGSWYSEPISVRSAVRTTGGAPGNRNHGVGFRLLQDL